MLRFPSTFGSKPLAPPPTSSTTYPPKPSTCNPLPKTIPQTPFFLDLKTFGCLCYPWTAYTRTHKLDPKSSPCIFLGYSTDHKGLRCFDPATSKFFISQHVRFHEHEFPMDTSPPTTTSPQITSVHNPLPPPFIPNLYPPPTPPTPPPTTLSNLTDPSSPHQRHPYPIPTPPPPSLHLAPTNSSPSPTPTRHLYIQNHHNPPPSHTLHDHLLPPNHHISLPQPLPHHIKCPHLQRSLL